MSLTQFIIGITWIYLSMVLLLQDSILKEQFHKLQWANDTLKINYDKQRTELEKLKHGKVSDL